jgi:hypothetical protein
VSFMWEFTLEIKKTLPSLLFMWQSMGGSRWDLRFQRTNQ